MPNRNHVPRLSIGMPVYNGENYLEKTIKSILSQKYADFELIISDNASTDNTPKICCEYAKRDKRIFYCRSEKKHGAAWNFNNAFKLSSGYYFKWSAHDDLHHPDHLLKCVQVLDDNPSVVLCYSKIGVIDQHGTRIGTYDYCARLNSDNPQKRFREILDKRPFFSIFGVMKRSALQKTPLLAGYIGSDWNLLAELSLAGQMFEIPEYLFFRREHEQAYTNIYYSNKIKIHDHSIESLWWTGNTKKPIVTLPCWKNCLEFFKSVNRSSLQLSEKLSCYNEIGKWLFRGSGGTMLYKDLLNQYRLFRFKLNST
ncbi:MAG: glycosyltransferase family 2 protein [Candidatus Bathyarchaeota archaeon]|nr:MAG: glycosyltransferase family 2 protein [Candidatus Bathyarchaeota archaeon]